LFTSFVRLHKKTAPLLAGLHKVVSWLSESIMASFITMAAGVLGAVIGAFVTLRIDKRAEKRRRTEERRTCYAQLLSAYGKFMSEAAITSELFGEIPPEKERDLFTQFEIAYNSALLICRKNSIEPFAEFYRQICSIHLHRDMSGIHSAYRSVLAAMRSELEGQNMLAKLRKKVLSAINKARKTERKKSCR